MPAEQTPRRRHARSVWGGSAGADQGAPTGQAQGPLRTPAPTRPDLRPQTGRRVAEGAGHWGMRTPPPAARTPRKITATRGRPPLPCRGDCTGQRSEEHTGGAPAPPRPAPRPAALHESRGQLQAGPWPLAPSSRESGGEPGSPKGHVQAAAGPWKTQSCGRLHGIQPGLPGQAEGEWTGGPL